MAKYKGFTFWNIHIIISTITSFVSKDNTITLFDEPKKLKKTIMGIQTDSKALEEPKDPSKDNVFNLFKLLASQEAIEEMSANYLAGGYGYGHAKKELLELIQNKFKEPMEKFHYFMDNKPEIDEVLWNGAQKAQSKAEEVLKRVRTKLGY